MLTEAPAQSRNNPLAGLKPVALILVLALLAGFAFFYNRVPWGKDTLLSYYPHSVFMASAHSSGQFPLWQPMGGFGMPAHAESQGGYFSPVHILASLIFPKFHVYGAILTIIFVFGFFFFYLFMRELGLSYFASIAASTAYVMGGFWINHVDILPILENMLYLPLQLTCVRRIMNEGPRAFGWALVAGCAMASALLAGHFQMAVLSGYLMAAYVLYCGISRRDMPSLKIGALLLALSSAIAVLLSAAQWLPTAELAGTTFRSNPNEAFIFSYSTFPALLNTLLLPDFWGFTSSARIGGISPVEFIAPGSYWENTCFMGVAVILVGFIGIRSTGEDDERGHPRTFFLWVFIVSILLSLGSYTPLGRVITFFPLLKAFRIPARFFGLASFSVATLFAMTIDDIWTGRARINFRRVLIPAAIIGCIMMGSILGASVILGNDTVRGSLVSKINELHPNRSPGKTLADLETLRHNASPMTFSNSLSISVFALSVLALFAASRSRLGHKKAAVILAALAFTELFAFDWTHTAWTRPSDIRSEPLSAGRIRAEDGDFARVYSDPLYYNPAFDAKELIPASMNIMFDVETCEYRGSLFPRRVERVMKALKESFHKMSESREGNLIAPFIAFGVTDILSAEPPFMSRIQGSTPRAYLADKIERANREDVLPGMIGNTLSRRTAWIEGEFDLPFSGAGGDVEWRSRERENLKLDINASDSGVLVVADQYYPGWSAFVDGKPQRILRANYLFRAVSVPPGAHSVQMVFQPVSFKIGIWVSLTGLFVLAGLSIKYLRSLSGLEAYDRIHG